MTNQHLPTASTLVTPADRRTWQRAAILSLIYAPLLIADSAVTGTDFQSSSRLIEMYHCF